MNAVLVLSVASVLAFAFEATAEAHVLDQYLEVAQLTLSAEGPRVELRLTPGVQVADRVFSLIDRDGDGEISHAEEQTYVQRVLQDISLGVDGRPLPLALTATAFPSRFEMREGVGAIRLQLAANAPLGLVGEHQVTFRNDHLPELGVYMANVLVPTSDAIAITKQHHDLWQHELEVRLRVAPDARTRILWTFALGAALTLLAAWGKWRKRAKWAEWGERAE